MMIWKKISFALFLLILSCSYKPSEKKEIKIVGSDTMLELTLNLAEQFMKENPGYFDHSLWRWNSNRN